MINHANGNTFEFYRISDKSIVRIHVLYSDILVIECGAMYPDCLQ